MALSDADKLMRIRRFYGEVSVGTGEQGFTVLLDGRLAKTSGGAVLAVPTLALAEVLAVEWRAQGEHIDFTSMPATRLAFTAIDRGEAARAGLAKEVARYASADTLCYPADTPRMLAERQAALWAPWRLWVETAFGLRFATATGLLHHAQPPETLAKVEALAEALPVFDLTGLVFAAGLYGSAILALAVHGGALDAVEAYELSRLEEAVQAEHWGLDAEAEARTEALRREAAMIGEWFAALR
jgi:chaperone required for assembly of F1-ATPase